MVQELIKVNYEDFHIHRRYVYLIRCKKYVKIGTSGNILSRLENYKSNNPEKMYIIGLFLGGPAEEKGLHEHFKHLFHRNEWFKYNDEIKQFCSHFTAVPLDEARDKLALERSLKYRG